MRKRYPLGEMLNELGIRTFGNGETLGSNRYTIVSLATGEKLRSVNLHTPRPRLKEVLCSVPNPSEVDPDRRHSLKRQPGGWNVALRVERYAGYRL
jgi:hypothetical protein